MMPKILIIDNERAIRNTLREVLELEGYVINDVNNSADGLALIRKNEYSLVLCDVKTNLNGGMDVLTEGLKINPD